MSAGAFELYSLDWFSRSAFDLLQEGLPFLLFPLACWRGCRSFLFPGVGCMLSCFNVILGIMFFQKWYIEAADVQPGVWLKSQCHVLATGILGYSGKNSNNYPCDPPKFGGYTDLACDQFDEMKAHKEWVDAQFSCEMETACQHLAWARVDIDGLGERCAYPLGYDGTGFYESWPSMCEARSRLMSEIQQATSLGRDTVQCWIKRSDNFVVSFEKDYLFQVQKSIFYVSALSCSSVVMVVTSVFVCLMCGGCADEGQSRDSGAAFQFARFLRTDSDRSNQSPAADQIAPLLLTDSDRDTSVRLCAWRHRNYRDRITSFQGLLARHLQDKYQRRATRDITFTA